MILFLCMGWQLSKAQVSGISYTLSPTVENVWWDDQAGIEDGLDVWWKIWFGLWRIFGASSQLYAVGMICNTDFT